MTDVFHYDVATSSSSEDIWPETENEMPFDLQNFDVDEFLDLQSDITGSEIDVNRLLGNRVDPLTSEPIQPVSPNSSVNSEGSTESGYTSQELQTVQSDQTCQELQAPDIICQQLFENTNNFDQNKCELSKSPIITYAVISENFPNFNQTKTTQQRAGIEPVVCGNQPDFDLFDNDSDFEDDIDQFQPIEQQLHFSGSKSSTLPTVYVVAKNHNSGNSFTEEERSLLAKEGVSLPENLPLTKMEERVLKKVRRKIRNRQSAQCSRQKKKDYVVNLENRVKKCTDDNSELQRKVTRLEMQNSTLMKQLSHLQAMLSNTGKSYAGKSLNATTGTCLMMVVFSCCFLMIPNTHQSTLQNESPEIVSYNNLASSVVSRTLLGDEELESDDSRNKIIAINGNNFEDSQFDGKIADFKAGIIGRLQQDIIESRVNKVEVLSDSNEVLGLRDEEILPKHPGINSNHSKRTLVKVSQKKSDL